MKSGIKKDLLVVLFLLLLDLFIFYRFLFTPDSMVYPSVEAVRQEYFWKTYLKNNLMEKSILPLWDINVYSGTVYLAIPNQSVFFPLNLLYLFLPVQRAIGFNMILDVFLAGVFCYLLARVLDLRRLPATASAVTYMFSGTVMAQIFAGNITQMNAIVWLPLVLALLELSIRTNSLRAAALGGLSWALMILSGHLQYPVYAVFLAGAYVLFRYLLMKGSFATHAKMLAVVLLVGVLVSAIRLAPVLEFSSLSTRASGLTFSEASQDSLPPLQSVNMLVPDAFGNHIDRTYWGVSNYAETSIYVSFVPLLLALFSVVAIRNKFVKIFSLLGLLSLVLMFGKFTPLFEMLISFVKPLSMFKTPVRFAFGFVVSVSILAGFGYQEIMKKFGQGKLSLACFAVALVSLLAIAFMVVGKPYILENGYSLAQSKFAAKSSEVSDSAIYGYYYDNYGTLVENYYARMVGDLILLMAASAGMGLFLVYRRPGIENKLAVIPLILIAVSLLTFSHKFTGVENPGNIFYTPEFLGVIGDAGNGRILAPIDVLPQHIAIREGLMLVTGYSEVINGYSKYLSYALGNSGTGYTADLRVFGLKHPSMLNDLGVKYFILPEKIGNLSTVFEGNITVRNELHRISYAKQVYVYENEAAKPKLFATNKFVVSDSEDLSYLAGVLEKGYVLLDRKPGIEIENGSAPDYDATIEKYEPNYLSATVNTGQNSILVLGDVWYPGWVATVDGREVPIIKVNTIIRAVELPAGMHKIEFAYRPVSLLVGALGSLFGLAVVSYLFYKKS